MERWPNATYLEWLERLEDLKQGNFATLAHFLRQHALSRVRAAELADTLEAYQATKTRRGRPLKRRPPLADLLGYPEAEAAAWYRNLRAEGISDREARKRTRAKFEIPTAVLNKAVRNANVKRAKAAAEPRTGRTRNKAITTYKQ